ncbi:CDP-diacylglycerol--serine O-phosphatidyltransferase [hydrothermal vent metagenome]|uniref:CDP-diacylglycerol--serine O-phosphatidyltransferase n=1 Tax=hydrothermal vent metagenome TaxID=652676 RepID=A0A3B1C197_9ZZZZ
MNRKISKSAIPNTATALNIASGFLSLVFTSHGDFHAGALFIFIAAFFDLIDGLLARLTKTTSMFGVELDSLADVVSFGAAPAFLIYQSYLIEFDFWGVIISSLLLIFGAFRLARFNVQIEDIKIKLDFNGLPIPIAALAVASLILFYHNGVNVVKPFDSTIIPSVIVLSLLMVSNIKYNTLPKVKKMDFVGKLLLTLISIGVLILISLTKGEAIFYLIWFHILFGILRYLVLRFFRNENQVEIKVNK